MNFLWKTKKYSTTFEVVKFILFMAAVGWLIYRGSGKIGYNWQWYQIPRYLYTFENGNFVPGPLLQGLQVTLEITGYSLLLATVLGLLTALLRLSGSLVGRIIARVYLEVIRNTPLLVQIFFLYFVLAPIFELERFAAAVIALSLFEGAYASEIFRAGILSIPQGQWEASHSLGLSVFDTYRTIILPQAIQRILPSLTGQAVSLVKDSALVSTIAVYDLTMQGRTLIAETFLSFEIWFTVAAIYLVITLTLSQIVNLLERRFAGGLEYA